MNELAEFSKEDTSFELIILNYFRVFRGDREIIKKYTFSHMQKASGIPTH